MCIVDVNSYLVDKVGSSICALHAVVDLSVLARTVAFVNL
jgi:hypothetical protein